MDFSTTKKLFGKVARLILFGIDTTTGEALAEGAYQEALRLHKKFDFYDSKSELSQLNQQRFLNKASPELLKVLKYAIKFCELTNGEYDISLGKKILARKKGEELDVECTYKNIKIKGNQIRLEHEDVIIDLGSIAKGFIADKMADYLKREGVESGLIDARGDIVLFGKSDESNEGSDENSGLQLIGVAHPRNKEEILLTIKLKNGGVATSGDYNQFANDFKHSHILNKKEFISVTVIAPTLMEADVFASAIFVSDLITRERLLNKIKYPVLAIDEKLNKKYYNQFENMVVTKK